VANVAERISRRNLIAGLAAASLLAGCKSRPVVGFLGFMQRWNVTADGLIFSPHRLAPELPPSAATPESAFPAYFISDEMPLPPPDWILKVGGWCSGR
jgi:hypothetical protein